MREKEAGHRFLLMCLPRVKAQPCAERDSSPAWKQPCLFVSVPTHQDLAPRGCVSILLSLPGSEGHVCLLTPSRLLKSACQKGVRRRKTSRAEQVRNLEMQAFWSTSIQPHIPSHSEPSLGSVMSKIQVVTCLNQRLHPLLRSQLA